MTTKQQAAVTVQQGDLKVLIRIPSTNLTITYSKIKLELITRHILKVLLRREKVKI